MTGTRPEEQREQPSRISPIAIIAGALASLSAAVVASYFGVAGTFIGTAVVSVVSSLAAALYAGLLGRTRGLVQRTTTITTVLHAPTPHPEDRDARASAEAPGERGPSSGPGEGEPSDHRRGGGLAGFSWRRSALVRGGDRHRGGDQGADRHRARCPRQGPGTHLGRGRCEPCQRPRHDPVVGSLVEHAAAGAHQQPAGPGASDDAAQPAGPVDHRRHAVAHHGPADDGAAVIPLDEPRDLRQSLSPPVDNGWHVAAQFLLCRLE